MDTVVAVKCADVGVAYDRSPNTISHNRDWVYTMRALQYSYTSILYWESALSIGTNQAFAGLAYSSLPSS